MANHIKSKHPSTGNPPPPPNHTKLTKQPKYIKHKTQIPKPANRKHQNNIHTIKSPTLPKDTSPKSQEGKHHSQNIGKRNPKSTTKSTQQLENQATNQTPKLNAQQKLENQTTNQTPTQNQQAHANRNPHHPNHKKQIRRPTPPK